MHFLVSEYSATGEGLTIAILLTQLHPMNEDYEEPPRFDVVDGEYRFFEGKLKTEEIEILRRQFARIFDGFTAMGMQEFDAATFTQRYGHLVPKMVLDIIAERSGHVHYYSQVHVNFS